MFICFHNICIHHIFAYQKKKSTIKKTCVFPSWIENLFPQKYLCFANCQKWFLLLDEHAKACQSKNACFGHNLHDMWQPTKAMFWPHLLPHVSVGMHWPNIFLSEDLPTQGNQQVAASHGGHHLPLPNQVPRGQTSDHCCRPGWRAPRPKILEVQCHQLIHLPIGMWWQAAQEPQFVQEQGIARFDPSQEWKDPRIFSSTTRSPRRPRIVWWREARHQEKKSPYHGRTWQLCGNHPVGFHWDSMFGWWPKTFQVGFVCCHGARAIEASHWPFESWLPSCIAGTHQRLQRHKERLKPQVTIAGMAKKKANCSKQLQKPLFGLYSHNAYHYKKPLYGQDH